LQIVCITFQRWERAERFQRLIQDLEDCQVLFFEPEQSLLSRLRRPREGVKLTENVTAYTLPASVPSGEEGSAQITLRSRRNAAYVRRCMADQGFESPLLWLTCPDQAGLLYEFNEARGIVYDCAQDWHGFPYDWGAAVTEEADVVLSASAVLEQQLSQLSGTVALLPNGVDYGPFSQSAEGFSSLPADLSRLPSPVIGYLGEVDGFTLLSPVQLCAENHPEWSFVFVGPYSRRNPGFARLSKLANVHFLGEKSPATLPRYLSGFDICFSLLSEHAPNPSVPSQQLFQYLSSGKNIAMFTGGRLDEFAKGLVTPCHFDYEFSMGCEALLELEPDAEVRERRMAIAAQADWHRRSQRLAQLLAASGLV
jgi:hypothetical protein